MKNLTTKSFLALFGLIMFANMANAQNMNRWIDLTVQQGQWIEFYLLADAENTKVKVLSGTYDTTLTVGSTGYSDLKYFYAGGNHMMVYGNIKGVFFANNGSKITEVDASNNIGLASLTCSDNNIYTLDVSGLTALEALDCSYNNIYNLNVSGCTALKELHCYNNNISALNVSGFTALEELYCYNNKISALDVSGLTALEVLDCSNNKISVLNVSGLTALEVLDCYSNNLSSIKTSGCERLRFISCKSNNLSACGLDSIFHQLPIRAEGNNGKIVIRDGDTFDNPGALSCRDTIAANRNWWVTDGDISIVNATYACPYFTIGIEDIMVNNLEAEIYPNPASNLLNVISENANELITISDLSGKIVHSEKASEKQTSINVSQLSAGMYIVRVGDKVTKFVKE